MSTDVRGAVEVGISKFADQFKANVQVLRIGADGEIPAPETRVRLDGQALEIYDRTSEGLTASTGAGVRFVPLVKGLR